MSDLDNLIFDEVRKLATDPNYIHDIRADKLTRTDDFAKIEILRSEIKSIDDQISRFMDLYGIGKFTIDQVSAKVDPLNDQKKLLTNELESLTATDGEMDEEEVVEIVKSFDDILKRGDINEIRLMLESLIFKIELDEDDIIIHWKFA